MNTIGFLISQKSGEKRRALLPEDIEYISHPELLYIEKGYGNSIGIADSEYLKYGCHCVSRDDALRCNVITDVKLGDADYIDSLPNKTILFGWAHAVQGVDFTSKCIDNNHTVIAWEEIFEDGRYIFYRNREIAGEAAIMHAFRYCGKMPYDTKVAIIGNGQTAKGAMRVLHGLGAQVDVYGRKLESLFRKNMYDYDVIVNCVMWDTLRDDRLIYKDDLQKMKRGTLIIDVSCDPYLEIETSHPTTIDNPVYEVDGVVHYSVDNTPSMFPITVSKILSHGIVPYINIIAESDYSNYPDNLKKAVVINQGIITDAKIKDYRKKLGL